jgi:hypothetical protein
MRTRCPNTYSLSRLLTSIAWQERSTILHPHIHETEGYTYQLDSGHPQPISVMLPIFQGTHHLFLRGRPRLAIGRFVVVQRRPDKSQSPSKRGTLKVLPLDDDSSVVIHCKGHTTLKAVINADLTSQSSSKRRPIILQPLQHDSLIRITKKHPLPMLC